MKKILKFLLTVFLLLVLAGLIALAVVQFGWSGWVGVSIFFAIIGIWLGIIYLRRLFNRRKMRDFVTRVVDQERLPLEVNQLSRPNAILALRKRWKDSIKLVRKSKVSSTIPWYLMLGGTDSGKTSAIKHAKLSTALSDTTKSIGISATENCDWWFLEKSIVLDTSSRYVVPLDEISDTNEWNEFLRLFVKYRGRKPLNGVVVTISAERLLAKDTMSLRDEGQNLRKRIDSLMQICWSKFPVYLMITKMDQVFGFSDTFLNLPEAHTDQAAGHINSTNQSWQNAVDDFIAEIYSTLVKVRGKVINEAKEVPHSGPIILPQEFLAIQAGLHEFAKAVFENNPYQEPLICRGIYLSSAHQDSTARSTILNHDGEYLSSEPIEKGGRGLFLRDFFGTVLPGDSDLVEPAYRSLKWRTIVSSTGMLSIICIFIAAACLYTASYMHNRNILNQFLHEFKTPPVMSEDINQNLITLNDFEQRISQLDNANKHWFLPSLGMTTSDHWVKLLKAKYVNLYKNGFLNKFDIQLNNNISEITVASDSATVSAELGFVLARISSIEYYINSGTANNNSVLANSNLAQSFSDVMHLMYTQLPPNVGDMSANTYNAYLEWNSKPRLNEDLIDMLKIIHALMIQYPDWRVTKGINAFNDISLSDFWGKSRKLLTPSTNPIMVEISGIFTKEGMAQIEHYFRVMEQAGIITGDNDPLVQKFWIGYRFQYFTVWQNFALNFDQGANLFPADSEKKALAISMLTENNPYQKFLITAARELAPDGHLNNTPDWVHLIIELNDLQSLAKYKIGQTNFEQKILKSVKKILPSNAINAKSDYLDRKMQAIDLLASYDTSLAQTNLDLISDDSYLRFMEGIFSEYNGTAEQKSTISNALLKFNQLQELLSNGSDDTVVVWQLEAGPMNYLLKYLMGKASCAIDAKWQSNIIGMVAEVPSDKIYKQLLDKTSGLLWKFVTDNLAPFLNLTEFGYTPKAIYEKTPFAQKINFNRDFMDFLNRVQPSITNSQAQYSVNIATVPVSVNEDATAEPYEVVLTVQCADGEQILKNYNHLNETSINWSPDKCGDTTISIVFPSLTLTKTYAGAMGFPQFLADFRSGSHKFASGDFPEKDTLKDSYNVNWINVKYNIDQGQAVINLLKSINSNIPPAVTDCRGAPQPVISVN